MAGQTDLEFEREKWRAEYELRKRELEMKEADASRARWSNPVVLAVLAAAVAGLGNAAAIWLNGIEQRKLETTKANETRLIEEAKAETARIFEIIKTGQKQQATENLKFLLDAGLIADIDRRRKIQAFVDSGRSPVLPPPPAPPPPFSWDEPPPSRLRPSRNDPKATRPDPSEYETAPGSPRR